MTQNNPTLEKVASILKKHGIDSDYDADVIAKAAIEAVCEELVSEDVKRKSADALRCCGISLDTPPSLYPYYQAQSALQAAADRLRGK